jgi:hypothetical protein
MKLFREQRRFYGLYLCFLPLCGYAREHAVTEYKEAVVQDGLYVQSFAKADGLIAFSAAALADKRINFHIYLPPAIRYTVPVVVCTAIRHKLL